MLLKRCLMTNAGCPSNGHGPVIVAIPVKDEEERIASCLQALETQVDGKPDCVVLVLNNCSDRTGSIINDLASVMSFELRILDVKLPAGKANAGFARYMALEEASRLAGDDGILLTTDADGRVDPNWVGANLAVIRNGADAVAGWAELDPSDWGAIPLQLHQDDAQECAYDAVCDDLHGLLDPDPFDPLPRHTQASGASIAVTGRMYRLAGGMPIVASSEDRSFIAALRQIDARIRHAPECRVVVSGRVEGRAVGGMADTIRRRLIAPDPYLDDRLEPAEDCARRAALRWCTRHAYNVGRFSDEWLDVLGFDEVDALELLRQRTFGAAWARVETYSPMLVRRRVATTELAVERDRAEALREAARHDPPACMKTLLHGVPSSAVNVWGSLSQQRRQRRSPASNPSEVQSGVK